MSNSFQAKKVLFIGVSIMMTLLFIALLFLSVYTVQSGYKDIVFTAGKATAVSDEGLHFKIPVYQSRKTIEIRTRESRKNATAASSDQQNVSTTVSVNYRFDGSKLIEIQKATGFDIEETIINPRIEETLKAVVSRYTAEGLIKERETVKSEIDEKLKNLLTQYNVIIEGVQVTDFKFSKEFDDAIERKQTQVQETLTAKNVLERTRIEAEQKIVQAQAEAETIRIQAQAIQAQGGSEYVQLKMIEKWSGDLPMVTGGGGMILSPDMLKNSMQK